MYIDTCVFAYKTSSHETAKNTPFFLVFGQHQNLQIDIEMQSKSIEDLYKHCLKM